jgi:hypothetical protein
MPRHSIGQFFDLAASQPVWRTPIATEPGELPSNCRQFACAFAGFGLGQIQGELDVGGNQRMLRFLKNMQGFCQQDYPKIEGVEWVVRLFIGHALRLRLQPRSGHKRFGRLTNNVFQRTDCAQIGTGHTDTRGRRECISLRAAPVGSSLWRSSI